jgi:hypothetical protein
MRNMDPWNSWPRVERTGGPERIYDSSAEGPLPPKRRLGFAVKQEPPALPATYDPTLIPGYIPPQEPLVWDGDYA